jgi:hypothetical protein
MARMAQFIVNPRRAPRAPARCQVAVIAAATSFDAETEDIGSQGCQLVSPTRLARGQRIDLAVTNEKLPDPLRIPGVVAWVSTQPPWRLGVAFDEALHAVSGRWFEKLVAAHPGLGWYRRVPDRIALEAMVYLGPPPRFLHDFTPEEATLLRAIGSGVRVDELQTRLRREWPATERALFSLLARHAVTLSRGQAAHPTAWKKILAEVEAALAVESLSGTPPSDPSRPAASAQRATPVPLATPVPVATPVPLAGRETRGPAPAPWGRAATPLPVASPWGVAPIDPHPISPGGDPGPSFEIDGSAGARRRMDGVVGWATPAPIHKPDHEGAGIGWRGPARRRSAEAQAAFDRARAELAQGSVNGALSLLRRALALAPGDAEIADELGKLAFKGRTPGAR